ncbi:SMP-30/gluconolactonase/LRE family protein [Saccharomonospora piscinae]|uniref:SMP-30/gluconolactonase/LRE family protein n=1 Tax=Saccharomonospora piscinae TaxID=687388 RepID=UPI000463D88E|nr:SMP-30/gluconolactonase/LRE family protein [Saccharomonospora piscinae]
MRTTASDRIPAEFEVHDERFRGTGGDRVVERIFDGGRWVEGPAYSPAWRCLVFSDIPNDRVLRWDETTGAVGVWQQPAGHVNGHTIDRAGRLVRCEQGHRRLTRVEPDGRLTVLAERWRGLRFNSPNDVVEHSDGSLWFTDPSYGIDSDYEGHRAEPEIDGCHVYRVAPGGEVTRVADDLVRPNGLAFSADERTLFVVDTRRKHIRRFSVGDDGALGGGDVFADCTAGTFDGIRLDEHGRLWAAAHDGLHCFGDDGTLLGKLKLPQVCSNLTFGGPRRTVLYVTATTAVYSIMLNVSGARV